MRSLSLLHGLMSPHIIVVTAMGYLHNHKIFAEAFQVQIKIKSLDFIINGL